MLKYIISSFLVLVICSNAYSAGYSDLTPGVSTKIEADTKLGAPIKEVIEGIRYDYDPIRHDLKRISLTFSRLNGTVETISLYFKEPYSRQRVKEWFSLKGDTDTTIDDMGNIIEYYLDDGISLYYDGPDTDSPVIMLSYFDPKQLIKMAGQDEGNVRQVEWQGNAIEITEAAPTSSGNPWTRLPVAREVRKNNDVQPRKAAAQVPALRTDTNVGANKNYQRGYEIGKALGRMLLGSVPGDSEAAGNLKPAPESQKWSDPIVPENPDTATVKGSVIFFDNFNDENGSRGMLNYRGLQKWDITEGSIDLIGNGLWDSAPKNGLHIDMDGTTNKAATLLSKQIFHLTPGTYRFQFDISGNPFAGEISNSVVAGLDGLNTEEFTAGKSDPFTTVIRNINVPYAKDVRIVFKGIGGDNTGVLIDNVMLTQLSGDPSQDASFYGTWEEKGEAAFTLPELSDPVNARGYQAEEVYSAQEAQGYSQTPIGRPSTKYKTMYQGRWVVFPSREEKDYFDRTHNIR